MYHLCLLRPGTGTPSRLSACANQGRHSRRRKRTSPSGAPTLSRPLSAVHLTTAAVRRRTLLCTRVRAARRARRQRPHRPERSRARPRRTHRDPRGLRRAAAAPPGSVRGGRPRTASYCADEAEPLLLRLPAARSARGRSRRPRSVPRRSASATRRMRLASAASSTARIGASPEPAARNRAGAVDVGSSTNVPYGPETLTSSPTRNRSWTQAAGLPIGDAGDQQRDQPVRARGVGDRERPRRNRALAILRAARTLRAGTRARRHAAAATARRSSPCGARCRSPRRAPRGSSAPGSPHPAGRPIPQPSRTSSTSTTALLCSSSRAAYTIVSRPCLARSRSLSISSA